MVVHHVEMDPIGAVGEDSRHFLAQPGEVGGEDAGGDDGGLAAHGDIIADSGQ
jgi:hypothetical protein